MKKLTLTLAILAISSLAIAQVNLINGLRACYPMDCDSAQNFAPATTPALQGTLFNITCAPGHNNVANTGFKFAGTTSSYIQLPIDTRLKPDTLSFTTWVQPLQATTQYILFTNNNCTSNHEGYALLIAPSGGHYHFQVVKANGSCSQIIVNGSSNIVTSGSTWYHVGFYMGNDSIKLYVNGVPDAAAAISINFNYNTAKNVYFGGTNLTFNYPFAGVMDNARFYNRKLNGNEFYDIYSRDPACKMEARPVGLISESMNDNGGLVYPNPSTGNFYIDKSSGGTFSIYDVTGKAVNYTTQQINVTTDQIKLTEKTPGFYFVKLYDKSGNVIKTSKVLITE